MLNIPVTSKKRVVIVGCGFAGLTLAKKLRGSGFQVVILDKNNYHQFQPLLYQVASAGLESSSISFPLRKIFQHYDNYIIRKAEVLGVDTETRRLTTSHGIIRFDYLVFAHGAETSYFGMEHLSHCTKTMKSVADAIDLRNSILQNFENALLTKTAEEQSQFMNIIIVGGGASGVEIAGALAEMRKNILPKDFPELDCSKIKIYLIEAFDRLLNVMTLKSSEAALKFLQNLGVEVLFRTTVKDCNERYIYTSTGDKIRSNIVIWTAGIKANEINGLSKSSMGKNGRIIVDRFNRIDGTEDIFAIGDVCLMKEEKFPNGHPQVAQVAIQQARLLAKNLTIIARKGSPKPFTYNDLGIMATIGRNLAVVELHGYNFRGFFAWLVWLFIHLMSIVGLKNRFIIFINWMWYYITYDQSLRLILKQKGSH